jgi:aspartate dehydrogenase
MRRVGLIGFGAAGRALAGLIDAGAAGRAELVGVIVRSPDGHQADARRLGLPFVHDAAALLALDPSLVVEAGGHEALRTHVPAILEAGVDVLSISVGALADPATLETLTEAATRGDARLRVPSGAIAALDAISAAAVGEVERVVHVVRKPPRSLLPPEEATEVERSGVARELYAGPARDAAALFPANVNVTSAVSLAGIGLDRTEVRVVADPDVVRNTHEVTVEGPFGRLAFKMENVPLPDNPKTGRIVPLSLARAIRALDEPVVVGG